MTTQLLRHGAKRKRGDDDGKGQRPPSPPTFPLTCHPTLAHDSIAQRHESAHACEDDANFLSEMQQVALLPMWVGYEPLPAATVSVSVDHSTSDIVRNADEECTEDQQTAVAPALPSETDTTEKRCVLPLEVCA